MALQYHVIVVKTVNDLQGDLQQLQQEAAPQVLLQQEADLKQLRLPGQVRFGIWDSVFCVFRIWYLGQCT